jgi:hypothetical protein
MSCKAYKNALTEAAASGTEPFGDLQLHLRECPACRVRFTEARSLFSAIDKGMSSVANTQASPSFLPRVRSLVGQEGTPKFSWTTAWAATAVAGSIFAVLAFTLLHGGKQPQQRTLQISKVHQPQSHKQADSQTIGQTKKNTTVSSVPVPRLPQHKANKSTRTSIRQQPEVLVPATERESYLRFVSALQRPEMVLTLKPSKNEEVLKVDPVQVAQLSVPQLDSSKD